MDTRFPAGTQISSAFRQLVGDWHENEPPLEWLIAVVRFPKDQDSFEGKIAHLGLINCFQWHLEDECRSHYDSFEIIAYLKYNIDQSNHRRVATIDEIDQQVAECLYAQHPNTQISRLALVSPGNVIDRLSILELKRFHLLARGVGKNEPEGDRKKALLTEQIEDVCAGLDELMDDLNAGRLRLKFYRMIKLYGCV